MDLAGVGRILVFVGFGTIVLGVLFIIGGALGLGRLPGDVAISGDNVKIYVPIATCIVLSVLLTIIVNVFFRK